MEIKKFVIVGGNSGVGKAFAPLVLDSNLEHELMITTRSLSPVSEVSAKKSSGKMMYYAPFDPLDHESLLKFRKAVGNFAGDDRYAVVMSIGYFSEHKLGIHHDLKENQDILNANYVAPANIMHVLIPHMLQHNGGHFIAFSCQSTQRHDPFMGAFTAAKSALESLIQTGANEYGGSDKSVLFNALRVASINTEFTVSSKPNGDIENYITTEELSDIVMETIKSKQSENRNGDIMNAFKYSKTFFTDGSLTRIKNENNESDIMAWKNDTIAKGYYPEL